MALADRLSKTPRKTQFEHWLDSLSPENREVIVGWLNDPQQSHASIVRAVRDDSPEDNFVGYPADKHTIATWRRKHVAG